MGLSTAEAKRQRRALLADIAAEHLRQEREKLAALRAKIRDVTQRRRTAMETTRTKCKAGALAARARGKARAQQIRIEARTAAQTARREEVLKARAVCNARKARIRSSALSTRDKARSLLESERKFRDEMRRIDAWAARKRQSSKTTALERRQESDDEVRSNIPAELAPLFEKVKRSIKGSTRQSRTEDFLNYAAEHPHEVVDAQIELSQREIAKLVHEEARLAKAVRRRHRPTAAELARIPF
jgi:hypothetical protein